MRTKLTVACALAAFIAVGGGTAEATGLIHTRDIAKGAITLNRLAPSAHKAQRQKSAHDIDAARGGRALTEKEYWRAQWRDEGAVFPGDK
jgi:hypothetical protein